MGTGLFSGDFIVPIISYDEAIARTITYGRYENIILFCLFLVGVMLYFNFRIRIHEIWRRVKDEE